MERIGKRWLIVLAAILVGVYGALTLSDAVSEWTTPPLHCPPPSAAPVTCVTIGGPSPWQPSALGLGSLAVGVCLLVLFRRLERRREARPAEAA